MTGDGWRRISESQTVTGLRLVYTMRFSSLFADNSTHNTQYSQDPHANTLTPQEVTTHL